MRVTVCELRDEAANFAEDWAALAAHARAERSDLVLLPEMPFAPWFALTRTFEAAVWEAAVDAHQRWLARLPELAPAAVAGSRPVNVDGRRLNEGFVWDSDGGYRAVHHKYYLPEDEGFWEASWYERGPAVFEACDLGPARLGMLICTELWFPQRARAYGQAGAHLVLAPRATGKPTVDKWLAGGRVCAVVAGAYALSSNHVSEDPALDLGGQGWVIGVDGEVLALTSRAQPFATVAIDLAYADRAKHTYPRYVAD